MSQTFQSAIQSRDTCKRVAIFYSCQLTIIQFSTIKFCSKTVCIHLRYTQLVMPGHYKKILRSHYNALLQCLHLKGFSPVCILSYTFRFPACIHAVLHCFDLTGFSPVLNYSGTMFLCFPREFMCRDTNLERSQIWRSGDLFCIITLISITGPLHLPNHHKWIQSSNYNKGVSQDIIHSVK